MKIMPRIFSLLVVTISILLTGCASFNMTKPAPAQSQPIAITFTNEELSGWSDLPTGVHRIPESQTIISGHQKGGAAGIIFGPLGVLVQSAINSNIGANSAKDIQDILSITLTSNAQKITSTLISSNTFANKFTITEKADEPRLSVSTAVIMTYVDDTNVRPYVLLKASLREKNAAEPIWSTRYVASTGIPLPMIGPGSWTADSGEGLKEAISANLEKAITFMLTDIASPHMRDDNRMVMVQGGFPYVAKRLQLVGYQLTEDEKSIVFVPKLGDILVFAGVNIMDKSVTSYRPAKSDDMPFKAID